MPPATFASIYHMDEWFKDNIKKYCPYIKRLEAAFVQAASDDISVLAASFGFDKENTIGGMKPVTFIQTMIIDFNEETYRIRTNESNTYVPMNHSISQKTIGRRCFTVYG